VTRGIDNTQLILSIVTLFHYTASLYLFILSFWSTTQITMDDFTSTPMDFAALVIEEPVIPPGADQLSFPSLPAGTSPMMFLSPFSLASESTGGVKGGSTLGLVYIENSSDVCCGVIQCADKRRFCIKPLGTCATKGRRTKLNVPGWHLYIKQARRG
jgi:hypothetical protein